MILKPILVACEESQAVTIALRSRGLEAYSCDLRSPSGNHPEWHIQQDILSVLDDSKWGMIIAFPPCTHLSWVGAVHLPQKYKTGEVQNAIKFFCRFLTAPSPYIAIENPFNLIHTDIRPATQIIQPWQFGSPYTKKTLFWLKNLPLLKPTNVVKPEYQLVGAGKGKHTAGLSQRDPVKRSKTPLGLANAIASQWGEYYRKVNQ